MKCNMTMQPHAKDDQQKRARQDKTRQDKTRENRAPRIEVGTIIGGLV